MLSGWQKGHRRLGFTTRFTAESVCWGLNTPVGQLAASVTSGLREPAVSSLSLTETAFLSET